uniref:Uncharacterized protein n=1 Tax=Anguilla anguilla TaxID=7936 RepID=A0A0E9WKT4_ANGAN
MGYTRACQSTWTGFTSIPPDRRLMAPRLYNVIKISPVLPSDIPAILLAHFHIFLPSLQHFIYTWSCDLSLVFFWSSTVLNWDTNMPQTHTHTLINLKNAILYCLGQLTIRKGSWK